MTLDKPTPKLEVTNKKLQINKVKEKKLTEGEKKSDDETIINSESINNRLRSRSNINNDHGNIYEC